jgi:hypothetical protein
MISHLLQQVAAVHGSFRLAGFKKTKVMHSLKLSDKWHFVKQFEGRNRALELPVATGLCYPNPDKPELNIAD